MSRRITRPEHGPARLLELASSDLYYQLTGDGEMTERHNESTGADPSPGMMRGRVVAVYGRRSPGSPRGVPPVSRMTLVGSANEQINVRHIGLLEGEQTATAQFVGPIPPRAFANCAICFAPGPQSVEHVPQRTIGGRKMTTTCHRCNNQLGSRLERPFLNWYDRAFEVGYSTDEIPDIKGVRHAGRMLIRQTDDGQPVLVGESARKDPAVDELFRSGRQFEMHQTFPTTRLVKLAAAKHAYLAACLWFGGFPICPEGDQIRDSLLTVRDHKNRKFIPDCEALQDFVVGRTGLNPHPLSLSLCRRADDPSQYLINLAGTVIVSWPFPKIDPLRPQDMRLYKGPLPDPRKASGTI